MAGKIKIVLPIMKLVPLAANALAIRITGMMMMIGYNSILDFRLTIFDLHSKIFPNI
jgi:hypothetical protein